MVDKQKVSFLGWSFLPFSPKLRINREARVFDQMTSDQAFGGLKHEYYHLQDLRDDPFQMTRPSKYNMHEQSIILLHHNLVHILNTFNIETLQCSTFDGFSAMHFLQHPF